MRNDGPARPTRFSSKIGKMLKSQTAPLPERNVSMGSGHRVGESSVRFLSLSSRSYPGGAAWVSCRTRWRPRNEA